MNANGTTWTTADLLSWVRASGAPAGMLGWLGARDQGEPAEAALRAARDEWREWAARLMPVEKLAWAANDQDWSVRCWAADRLPAEQLGWATADEDWRVRYLAACRMPAEQLGWAAADEDWSVRCWAALRLPVEQLAWAVRDRSARVREEAKRRMRDAGLEVRS